MTDPSDKVADTGAFGAGGAGAGADTAAAPRDTSQDERPSRPSKADQGGGTVYKPAPLDRPLPGDEPLSVRFEKEE